MGKYLLARSALSFPQSLVHDMYTSECKFKWVQISECSAWTSVGCKCCFDLKWPIWDVHLAKDYLLLHLRFPCIWTLSKENIENTQIHFQIPLLSTLVRKQLRGQVCIYGGELHSEGRRETKLGEGGGGKLRQWAESEGKFHHSLRVWLWDTTTEPPSHRSNPAICKKWTLLWSYEAFRGQEMVPSGRKDSAQTHWSLIRYGILLLWSGDRTL